MAHTAFSSFIYLPNVYIASEFVMSIVPILCGGAVWLYIFQVICIRMSIVFE